MLSLPFPSMTHSPSAPPTESLDSEKKASPIMLLSGSRRLGQPQGNNCLALMWPSENEAEGGHALSPISSSTKTNLGGTVVSNTNEQDTIEFDSPQGKGTMSLDRTTEVMVCPSGQTVVRVKASMEAVLQSPAQGNRGSPSGFKRLMLPSSPNTSQHNRSKPGTLRDDSHWHPSGGRSNSPLSFPGRSLLFDSGDKHHGSIFPSPSPARSPSPTRNVSSGGDTPLPTSSPAVKKKGPRRRKISGKDKGSTRFVGGARGILEQDHPEEDATIHSRCPCFKFFLLLCLAGLILAFLFYLSLWLVAQHRGGSPIIVGGGETLQSVLQMQVFGQPIAVSLLPQLLSGFLAKDSKDRALVLMFQGQSGTGKTFVAELIQSRLFSEQAQHPCTKKFLPSYEQVKEHLVTAYDYSIALEDFIDKSRANHRTCPVVVNIIEDLDFADSLDLIDAVAYTLESVRRRQASQEQKMVFILVTNIQGGVIGDYLQGQLQNGLHREHITLKELDPVLKGFPSTERAPHVEVETSAKEDQTKMDPRDIHSKLLSVIDHHIPFYPLERKHVIMCIRRTLTNKNLTLANEDVEWIADKLAYYPEDSPMFSSSGCKKVEEKTNLFSKYSHKA